MPYMHLLRFSDILRSRIEKLAESFSDAIEETGYTSDYTVVYPIKVNQQRHIVEEIVDERRRHAPRVLAVPSKRRKKR